MRAFHVSTAFLVALVSVMPLGCCEKRVTWYCAACAADSACRHCVPMRGYKTQKDGTAAAKQRLCENIVGVAVPGLSTNDKAACMSAPESRITVTCQPRNWTTIGDAWNPLR